MNAAFAPSKKSSTSLASQVVAFSISYEADHTLARGMGLEHLRELLIRLVRPLLSHGASIAYGGKWERAEGNFTYELLDLINAERQDQTLTGTDEGPLLGKLINHSAWPHYLAITPKTEAEWIHCCHIIRVTQEMANIKPSMVLADDLVKKDLDKDTALQFMLNRALALSAMRRVATVGVSIHTEGLPRTSNVPGLRARVVLGGKLSGYLGFIPGVLEEVSLALEHGVPLYILGGFGGAAEVLAKSLLNASSTPMEELTAQWHLARVESLGTLNAAGTKAGRPASELTEGQFARLDRQLGAARRNLSRLRTQLSEPELHELMTSTNPRRTVELALKGIRSQ
jgi:hypothetical protein